MCNYCITDDLYATTKYFDDIAMIYILHIRAYTKMKLCRGLVHKQCILQ